MVRWSWSAAATRATRSPKSSSARVKCTCPSAPAREVHLSIRARQTPLPQRFLGRDVFDYLDRLGLMRKTVDSRLAQRLKDRETLIGSTPPGARNEGIQLRKRVTGAQGSRLSFADGSQQQVSTVIWATGFRLDHSFVQLPVFEADGHVAHRR